MSVNRAEGFGLRGLGLLGIPMLLSACGGASSPTPKEIVAPSPAQIAYAADATPADATLASLYERSCKTCHSAINTGAPLTGHAAAWASRLTARDEAGLLASTKKGLNAMPANGLCADCTDDQFKGLIRFMSAEGR
jgi:cytochrome c5